MILVLNLGLKSVRAIVFDREGVKRRSASRTVRTTLQGSWIEQDASEWWRLAMEVMREALADHTVRASLEAITVTSSSCCLVGVDQRGEPVRPAIMVSDHRAVEEAGELERLDDFVRARERHGNLVAEASLMVPKMMWLRRHEPEVDQRVSAYLGSNDYLLLRLCGQAVTDPLNAEKFCYLRGEGRYAESLLGACKVPVEKLPRVVDQGTVVGDLLKDVKETVGMEPGKSVSVVVTTYDAICAFFGSGAHEIGHACDVSGTVTSLRVLAGDVAPRHGSGIYAQYEAQTGCHIVGGSNNLGGGLVEWTKQCLYPGEARPYELMEEEAAQVPVGAEGVVFLPYLMGERAPLWDLDARGVFFGLERRHLRPQLVRAVFESAAYSLVYLKEAIESTGTRIERLTVSGGLARLPLIAQIKADVLESHVEMVEEFETTSVGAFLLSALALGWIGSLAEASGMVRIRQRLSPNAENSRRYRGLVGFYKDLYESSRPLFEKRKALMQLIDGSTAVAVENL